MKSTITISEVFMNRSFTNENGLEIQLVNLNIVEKLPQFQVEEDEKKLIEKRQFTIKMSDFKRLLVLDPMLALVPNVKLSEEEQQLPKNEQLMIQFGRQIQLLRAAKLTIDREEVKTVEYSDKPVLDENGEPKKDANGDIVYEPQLDDDGKPKQHLVGFGETSFIKLELTSPAAKLAERFAFNA